jgi:hypothetical protein
VTTARQQCASALTPEKYAFAFKAIMSLTPPGGDQAAPPPYFSGSESARFFYLERKEGKGLGYCSRKFDRDAYFHLQTAGSS